MQKGGKEKADNGGVDAGEGGAQAWVASEEIPEGVDGEDGQQAGGEKGEEGDEAGEDGADVVG